MLIMLRVRVHDVISIASGCRLLGVSLLHRFNLCGLGDWVLLSVAQKSRFYNSQILGPS